MAVIGMAGPHAVGKTTAAKRWRARYGALVSVVADNQVEYSSAGEKRVKAWKGTAADKELLVKQHQQANHVALIESARTTCLAFFKPTDPIIFVVCSWQVFEKVMRARCVKNNKKYREDYWEQRKLEYECRKRYINFGTKYLNPDQYKLFEINNQERDWPAVDEYFGQLFRKLNNRLTR